ncbi:MAG: acetate--CoA ligase family protein [Burkholderiales bacterium]
MPERSAICGMLHDLLNPRAIAIVGASPEERRPGGQPLHALTHYGYAGKIFAVNPRRSEINGIRCYPDVKALPAPVDLAVIALPAREVAGVIEQCGEAGIRNAVILSAGFREIGQAGAEIQRALDSALARSRVRAVGPNCVGVLNLRDRVFAGFGAGFRQPHWKRGPVAMISQSGGFAYSIVGFCQEAGVGVDFMISTGNEADLGVLDFVEHFLADDEIRLVAVYLEGLNDGRRLRALGRKALEARKPIAVWKVGNTAVGQRAAHSHTANLTEEYDFYRDAFREGGFIEVREVYDLIDAAKAFGAGKTPRGRRVAIVTTSGGAGVLLADRCEELRLTLPALAPESTAELARLTPAFGSLANPIDLTATLAQKEPEFSQAGRIVAEDANVDVAILRSFPGGDATVWAEHLAAYSKTCLKPLLVSLSGTPAQSSAWAPMLEAGGVPCFEVPSRAAQAAAMLCEFAERASASASIEEARAIGPVPLRFPESGAGLDEIEAKGCLNAYGISTPRRAFVDAAVSDAMPLDLRFPVAVKVVSPDIVHKTEAGGVRVSIERQDVGRTIEEMRAAVQSRAPQAELRGFVIEEMAAGIEMIVGAINNPSFGPLVLVGMGGVQAEVLRDVVRHYAPVSVSQAHAMVNALKGARLLRGYRGQPPVDLDALAQAIHRLSLLISDHEREIAEVEVNPLLVSPAGAIAVDAVIRLSNYPGITASPFTTVR